MLIEFKERKMQTNKNRNWYIGQIIAKEIECNMTISSELQKVVMSVPGFSGSDAFYCCNDF